MNAVVLSSFPFNILCSTVVTLFYLLIDYFLGVYSFYSFFLLLFILFLLFLLQVKG